MPQLDDIRIVGYDFSPNGRFVHFCYSNSTILNDYADDAADAVVDVDGKTFVSRQQSLIKREPATCSFETLY